MTATTLPSTRTTAVPNARSPRRRVTQTVLSLVRASSFYAYPVVLVIVAAGIAIGIHTFGTLSNPTWGRTVNHVRFVVGAGGMVMFQVLRTIVVNGITRRDAVRGFAVGAVGLGALAGGIIALGYAVEWLIYRNAAGVEPHVTSLGELVVVWAASASVLLAYFVSGWLVAAAFRNLPWVTAIPAIVLALLPALVTETAWSAVIDAEALTFFNLSGAWPLTIIDVAGLWPAASLFAAAGVSLVALAAGHAVIERATRTTPFYP